MAINTNLIQHLSKKSRKKRWGEIIKESSGKTHQIQVMRRKNIGNMLSPAVKVTIARNLIIRGKRYTQPEPRPKNRGLIPKLSLMRE